MKQEKKIENPAVDLRGNGGGDSYVSVFIVASDGKEKSSLQRGCFFGANK